jgi:hypothetical protein
MKYTIMIATAAALLQTGYAQDEVAAVPQCAKPKSECKPKVCKPVCEKKPDPCCPPVCFEQGHEIAPNCIPPAYNQSAMYKLDCSYDTFATMSFIYWDVMQGGMDIALPWEATVDMFYDYWHSAAGNAVLFQKSEYTPGFQIGVGWSGAKDSWLLSLGRVVN